MLRLADRVRQIHFGENWTEVSLKNLLHDVSWETAIRRLESLHTIAELTFHINYFVRAALGVLDGGPLTASDKVSFDLTPIENDQDWQQLLNHVWTDAELLADSIERLPDSKLTEIFVETKYQTYDHNLNGVIEHAYYHLGQIAFLKKLLSKTAKPEQS